MTDTESKAAEPTDTVYVTRYALSTGGPERYTGKISDGRYFYPTGSFACVSHGHYHHTLEAALQKCEAMRAAKIKSLEKQIAKLRALKFEERTA